MEEKKINPNVSDKDIEKLLKKAEEQVTMAEQFEKKEQLAAARMNKNADDFQYVDCGKSVKKSTRPAASIVNSGKPEASPGERKAKVDDVPTVQVRKTVDSKPKVESVKPKTLKPADEKDVAMEPEKPYQIKETVGNPYKEELTAGRVIAGFLEAIWTIFKVTVFVTIVTVVVGVLLSRDMMIRGRNGVRQSTQDMVVSGEALANHTSEAQRATEWKESANLKKLTLETDDNRILVARMCAEEDRRNWAVILHGYNGCMEDIYDIAMRYDAEGYNVLMPDLRGNGESEGSFLGMGWLDRLDVINWIDVILKEDPSAKVVIHGVDVGADTALMMAGEPLKSNIKGIVAEGAYTSAWDVVKKEYKLRREKLPVFPFLHMINPVMKVWAGYTLKEADAVKQVKNAKIPIMLIHGQKDTYADDAMTQKLDLSISSQHEVLMIPSGTHEDCRFAAPDLYYDGVFSFMNRCLQ